MSRVTNRIHSHMASLHTHVNTSCHTYEWVASQTEYTHIWPHYIHIWISRVTHMNESRHIWPQYIHMWICRVTHMNKSCHRLNTLTYGLDTYTCEYVVSHIWISRVTDRIHSHMASLHTHVKKSCHTWISRVTDWIHSINTHGVATVNSID